MKFWEVTEKKTNLKPNMKRKVFISLLMPDFYSQKAREKKCSWSGMT